VSLFELHGKNALVTGASSGIGAATAVALGIPQVPGQAVNRHCAAGLAAVQQAVSAVRARNRVVHALRQATAAADA